MNKYIFNRDDAYQFAKVINYHTKKVRDELTFDECPYCHGGESHDKNTFSINLNTGAFNCFRSSCGVKGNMVTLANDFKRYGFELHGYIDETPKKYVKLPEDLKIDVRQEAIDYLKSRGISEEITKEYEITVQKDNKNNLVFPFFDENNKPQCIKYRNTKFNPEIDSNKEWFQKDTKPILFGMNHCNFENDTLVITEGQIDSLSCTQAGIENAVSVPTGCTGFTWIPNCWDFLHKFKTIIVFGDHEKGHITLLDEISNRFDWAVIKHVREEDYKEYKDANDILRGAGTNQLKWCISNAVMIEYPHIKSMAEVTRVELDSIKHFSTGMPKVDNELSGGFYEGQLIILTGERGKGKSTLGSQWVAHAIRQRIPTLMYSGEMQDWQVQDWIEKQIVGRDGINTLTITNTAGAFNKYVIKDEMKDKLVNFYKDYLFVYEAVQDNNEKLIDTFKNAITKYGIKLIIVDNLMTAMDDDLASDIYREQTKFVKDLTMIAHKYSVVIILIAHPKKVPDNARQATYQNDDILGSSNITNLADIVMRYDKPKKGQAGERCLYITKNRLTGRVVYEDDRLPMYYQEETKRIVDCPADFNVDLMSYTDNKQGNDNVVEFDIDENDLPF